MATYLESQARWYVYTLADPRDQSVFYVGKGCRGRINHHERDARNGKFAHLHKTRRILNILADGLEVQKRKVALFWDDQAAYDYETELIAEIGLPNLTNVYPGGQIAFDRRKKRYLAKKFKPAPPIQLEKAAANCNGAFFSRMAEWIKVGGHKGARFKFKADTQEFLFCESASDAFYNVGLPAIWKALGANEKALDVVRRKLAPYQVVLT